MALAACGTVGGSGDAGNPGLGDPTSDPSTALIEAELDKNFKDVPLSGSDSGTYTVGTAHRGGCPEDYLYEYRNPTYDFEVTDYVITKQANDTFKAELKVSIGESFAHAYAWSTPTNKATNFTCVDYDDPNGRIAFEVGNDEHAAWITVYGALIRSGDSFTVQFTSVGQVDYDSYRFELDDFFDNIGLSMENAHKQIYADGMVGLVETQLGL